MRARVPTAVLLACSAASACGQILNEIGSVVPGDIVAGDQFGNAVAVSGLHLVAGAFRDDDAGTNSGSAYVFDLGTGQQLYKLTASDAGELDSFGSSVSVHGEFAVVGACFAQHDGVVTGAAYVFDLADGAELRKLVAFDGEAYDRFGDAVSISSPRGGGIGGGVSAMARGLGLATPRFIASTHTSSAASPHVSPSMRRGPPAFR